MNISGTISNAQPVDSGDNMGNKYQWITIQTPTDSVTGRIGSKQGYVAGGQISVTVEEKQGDSGPYNYFKKFNPQYGGAPSAPPQGRQQTPQNRREAPKQPTQASNTEDMVRIRSMALSYAKDLVVAGSIEQPSLPDYANEFTAYIMTGRWFSKNKTGGTPPLGCKPSPDKSREMAQEFEQETINQEPEY